MPANCVRITHADVLRSCSIPAIGNISSQNPTFISFRVTVRRCSLMDDTCRCLPSSSNPNRTRGHRGERRSSQQARSLAQQQPSSFRATAAVCWPSANSKVVSSASCTLPASPAIASMRCFFLRWSPLCCVSTPVGQSCVDNPLRVRQTST